MNYNINIIQEAWQNFKNNGNIDDKLNPIIKRSWKRCIDYEVFSSGEEKGLILNGNELKERLERNDKLIYKTTPIMQEIFQLIKGSNFIVILTDRDGYILNTISDPGFKKEAIKVELIEGANWGENTRGTNAIGTSIAENKPVNVYATEHLLERNHILTCSASPIKDKKGEILGVLNISGNYQAYHPHTLALINKTVQQIEIELQESNNSDKSDKKIFTFKKNMREQKGTADYYFSDIIGNNEKIMEVKRKTELIAGSDTIVLLTGETGTGKELFAHAIHNHSKRFDKPFVVINCSSIPDELFESELFGYVDGAFTGSKKGGKKGSLQTADGGTVFLDEIEDLSIKNQARLLRFLEDKIIKPLGSNKREQLDIRLITATNKSLKKLVEKGEFREDLYYRLNVINLKIPPLRDRRDDIIPLARYYLNKFVKEMDKKNKPFFTKKVLKYMYKYDWPGNVRELKNTIKGILTILEKEKIEESDLPEYLYSQNKTLMQIENCEKENIYKALKLFECNISRAAQELNISRNTLYRKIKKYNIGVCPINEQ
jgi:sigma-54 dependent transcriptional regulator, acetoin dehydrogenase operon transcriptional activator AcoR